MLAKNLNTSILITSQVLRLGIILYVTILTAKILWWLILPLHSDIYVEKTAINQFDNSAKYIINRHPFGIVTEQKPKEKPAITSQINLTGVYLNTRANSVAFFEINGKPVIAKTGGTIEKNVTLKTFVDDNSVIITSGSTDTTLTITSGANKNSEGANLSRSSYSPATTSYQQHSITNDSSSSGNTSSTTNNNHNTNTNNTNTNNTGNITNNEDFLAKRRKLMDEYINYQQQNKERPTSQ